MYQKELVCANLLCFDLAIAHRARRTASESINLRLVMASVFRRATDERDGSAAGD